MNSRLIEKIANEALLRMSEGKEIPTPKVYESYFKACVAENGITNYDEFISTADRKNKIVSLEKSTKNINYVADNILNAVSEHTDKLSESEKNLEEIVNLEDIIKKSKRLVSEITAIKDANKLLKKHINRINNIVNHELVMIEKMENVALRDYLTGIGNRQLFDMDLKSEMSRSKRYNRNVSILMLDLDDFKHVNDSYGHVAGDKVLQSVVNYTKSNIRTSDSVYRYGGDEFIVLLPETNSRQAADVGNKILNSLNNIKYKYKSTLFKVTSSCGMTVINKNDSMESVLERLDNALYSVKRVEKGEFYCVI
ncbi:MAG: GGDEF domain-containing protein [Epsilonproteobacteria bacterium]|nr:GGDEF domain-containing protein [Campylobacterota bacterium]